jgi:hypothetical protein
MLPVTKTEAGKGLVPPAVATHLFDATGSWMVAIMLFMAIVSTGSAESIAVSSLVSYDIYLKYVNPEADGTKLLKVGRYAIAFWGILMGVLSWILLELGIGLGWVYQFMGNAIGSAVPPLWFLLTWDGATTTGVIAGAIGGLAIAISLWMIVASQQCIDGGQPGSNPGCTTGEINLDTLGSLNANLAGNLGAILGSTAIIIGLSMPNPQKYNFDEMNSKLKLLDDAKEVTGLEEKDYSPEELAKAAKWINCWGSTLTITLIIIWPALSLPAGHFSKDYFAFWVILSLIWGAVSAAIIVTYPIVESWPDISRVLKGLSGGGATAAE